MAVSAWGSSSAPLGGSSAKYSLSASATGLTGTLVLKDSKGETLTFTSDTTQTFSTSYTRGSSYTVGIATQPSGQTCSLSSNADGTIAGNVSVTAVCPPAKSYDISVTTTGLTGTLVVEDSKGKTLTFKANRTKTFSGSYTSGSTYSVSITSQPSGQTCTLSSNASGTITSPVTVTATCTSNYTISAAVTGLNSGTTLVLQDNGSSNLTFTSNGTQAFSTQIAGGSTYAVTILTPPTGETCTLGSNASGTATANVTVSVTCTATLYTISAAVTGLNSGTTLVLQDNGSSNLTFTSNGTQAFSTQITSGSTYAVTILTPPTGETCTLGSNASGTATANVTVSVTCTATLYTISATVTGLNSGATLVLQDNGSSNLTFTSNGTQAFSTQIASGSTYAVTILTPPTGETCTLGSNASGTATSNVTVSVTCTATLYTISATVTGLTGTLVLQDNLSDSLTFTSNTTQTFATSYASGSAYSVSVTTQPSGQTCTLGSNASGTVTANVIVTATCAPATYTIGGTVYDLGGAGLVLQNNSGNNLSISANGSFTFSTAVNSGTSYNVTVLTQPSSPVQVCSVTNGSGTASGNVSNVQVVCIAEWTWKDGSKKTGQAGIYGTVKVTSSTNMPGARYGSVTWIDSSGNLWMFGGTGVSSQDVESFLSDLWKYTPSTNEWTWMGGSNTADIPGVYTGNPGNLVPGAREYAVGWVDSSGNFWLFGGYGCDGTASTNGSCTAGVLNDLWEYSGGFWIYVGGSSTANPSGTYNGVGTAGYPGPRYAAVGALDHSGNFWLFGGNGFTTGNTAPTGDMNDLWEYSNGTWTWVSGSSNLDQSGSYSSTASPSNVPGGRLGSSAWIDSAGDFWLFAGVGYDSVGDAGPLNDVWEYSQGEWAWVGGANIADQPGNYGSQGIPASGNIPGSREHAILWTTASGNVWLLGGIQNGGGELNDLWEYSGGQWTYMSGSESIDQFGVYGTEGTAAITNLPGARDSGLSWTDASGNLWLMGGYGLGSGAGFDSLNDLWEFQP